MKLSLRNVGKVREAEVEINGITVIAGENNTGKSTVGKALFAVFNGLFDSDGKIVLERANNVLKQFGLLDRLPDDYWYTDVPIDEMYIAKNLVADIKGGATEEEKKLLIVYALAAYAERNNITDEEDEIAEVSKKVLASFSIKDDVIIQKIMERYLNAEFNNQVSNIYEDKSAEVKLKIKSESIDMEVNKEGDCRINKYVNLRTEAVYIDDPFALDDGNSWMVASSNHREHLASCLRKQQKQQDVIDEILTGNKLSSIYAKIGSVCDGEIVRKKGASLGYKASGSDKVLEVKNLSTGLKTFVILRMLLMNGSIKPKGTVILDEPEIHLHPEWQLLFAELIVLLCKEFGLHILLNTHSPYFLNAIEVYAAKYGVDDKCKYYLAYNEGKVSLIEDVTHNIEKIYHKLAIPLQRLENERYRND